MKYKKAYIEITNICNLNCDFCPKNEREKKYMTKKEFEFVINNVKQQTDFVYFHLMGEPLMHQEIDKLLDICTENNMKVNITTNGFLIEKQLDKILTKESLRKISFSLHSYESNIAIANKSLEKYIDDILIAGDKLAENKKIVVLKLWNLDSENIKGKNELNIEICELIQKHYNLSQNVYESVLKNKSMKLAEKIYIQVANKFEWPDSELNDCNEKIKCYGLIDQFGILVDGSVVPCCLDNNANLLLGNVFETPLAVILKSPRATNIHKANKCGIAKEKLCQNCEFAKNKLKNN